MLCQLALIGSWLVFSPTVQGSTRAFHEYLAHQHAQETTTLPGLHEFIPAHVPTFTPEGAIRYWQTHDRSPYFRSPQFEVQLCEAVMERRDTNPANFDHYHPRLGRLLGNPQFFAYALHLYQTNPTRFTLYHHHWIPLIRGCALMMNMNTPPATGPLVISPGTSNVTPVPGEVSNGPGPTGSPPAGPEQNNSVPAPPGIVLMVIGAGYVATRLRRPRRQPAF